jgi:hypothetical protein
MYQLWTVPPETVGKLPRRLLGMEDEVFEIFLHDLAGNTQDELLGFLGLASAEDGNLDVQPIAIVPKGGPVEDL